MAILQHRMTVTPTPENRTVRLLPIRWALGLSLTVAIALLSVIGWIVFVPAGAPDLPTGGALSPSAIARTLLAVLGTVCGIVGLVSVFVVALVIAYRRQRITEAAELRASAAEQRESTKLFNERFSSASAQLGHHAAAVRLAGVYAVAGLADDWARQRQVCIDVLCAYLRMPYDPDNHRDGEREVRHSIIRVIRDHLRANAPTPWHGQDFDFTNATFDGGDLSGANFTGGTVQFSGAKFTNEIVNFRGVRFAGASVQFGYADFASDVVDFSSAEFVNGHIDFNFATFASGHVVFSSAKFVSDTVDFRNARFTGGMVYFDGSEFASGTTDFSRAEFASGRVLFNYAKFSGARVYFNSTEFAGGVIDFNGAHFSAGTVNFGHAKFAGGLVDLSQPSNLDTRPVFDSMPTLPEGLMLPPAWPGTAASQPLGIG
jgi:uncharacterized protein YjbI with pentapeptide repeats